MTPLRSPLNEVRTSRHRSFAFRDEQSGLDSYPDRAAAERHTLFDYPAQLPFPVLVGIVRSAHREHIVYQRLHFCNRQLTAHPLDFQRIEDAAQRPFARLDPEASATSVILAPPHCGCQVATIASSSFM